MTKKLPRLEGELAQAVAYTGVPAPVGSINQKNLVSSFLKTDNQHYFARRSSDKDYEGRRAEKRRRLLPTDEETGAVIDADHVQLSAPSIRAQKVLIIHPGSRNLRIGRASDIVPLVIPTCVARRIGRDSTAPRRPEPGKDETLDAKINAIREDYRVRVRAYKLRPTTQGHAQAQEYNKEKPLAEIAEGDAELQVSWTDVSQADERAVYVGQEALKIGDPDAVGWTLRWPYDRGQLTTRGYASPAEVISDVDAILRHAVEQLGINVRDLPLYSVLLVVPDLFDRAYLREMGDHLLRVLGFKQLGVQFESLSALMTAGVSTGVVVDIGATATSITCVEDSLISADSRTSLALGGDDITELYLQLLIRVDFQYPEANLNRNYDWRLIESLKERTNTLSEVRGDRVSF